MSNATFYVGDVLDVLGKLPENSVDLVLSSPPFLALRSYLPADHPDKEKEGGSQSTPGEYIDWLLDVVEACDRVLAPHGSLCFELGDTYAGSAPAGNMEVGESQRVSRDGHEWPKMADRHKGYGQDKMGAGWPLPKSLSLIPESFRFAMVYGFNPFTGRQTERWRLRNVIRWVRPNPPVGALGDKFRPATSDLMVFCKSAKRYFDLDSVREPYKAGTLKQYKANPDDPVNDQRPTAGQGPKEKVVGWQQEQRLTHSGAPPLDWWELGEGDIEVPDYPEERRPIPIAPRDSSGPPLDWWNIPPGGYEGAHYAVWPPELLIKPIKAMCPEQVCRTCGEARRRVVESERTVNGIATAEGIRRPSGTTESLAVGGGGLDGRGNGMTFGSNRTTLGFSDCGHDDYRPGVVLDCFGGSGTTAAVATGHGRDCVLIDLDERNYDLALERVGPLVLQRGEVAA